jgi:XTP/dITP diphosphohydrolase
MALTEHREILIATHNSGKIREVREALRSLPVKLRYLDEFRNIAKVDEVGRTYEENAVLKALGYAKQTGIFALADDSGIEVQALGGKPGVFSARFAGEEGSDRDRTEKLLAALAQEKDSNRNARFVSCMAIAGWQPTRNHARTDDPQGIDRC